MTKVRVVTGFVSIPGHPRPEEEYHQLAHGFGELAVPPIIYITQLHDCWLQQWLDKSRPPNLLVSRGDNPAKNTESYHIVQHQKTEWLKLATMADDDAETFIWMDYGIFHQPGVTAAVISEFLKRVRPNDFAIPGCWSLQHPCNLDSPSWRFCGSLIIIPRQYVSTFDALVKLVTKQRVRESGRITFEINDWAEVERMKKLPIRWYGADHNRKQFTNYV